MSSWPRSTADRARLALRLLYAGTGLLLTIELVDLFRFAMAPGDSWLWPLAWLCGVWAGWGLPGAYCGMGGDVLCRASAAGGYYAKGRWWRPEV